jgi:Cu(I)/Ag(I) efflux system membrane protein CusA/SilA
MVGATVLSVTLVPVLCSLLIGGRVRREEDNPVMCPLTWLYRPVLGWALRHRVLTLAAAALVLRGRYRWCPGSGASSCRP